jgi:hypothetical protein
MPEETPTGRGRFDGRKDVVRTIYEGSLLVSLLEFDKTKNNVVYAMYSEGYLPWRFNENGGIENYDENGQLLPYKGTPEEFVAEKLEQANTSGFIAMDGLSLFALLWDESLDKGYLGYGLGIKRTKKINLTLLDRLK